MSQDDPKHEEHLHGDQDEVAGTDEPRFGEQQEDAGDETEKPKQGSSDAASADGDD
jgi:hypothetical protein